MGSAQVDNLSPAQEQALVALLNEPTVLKAAQVCGVGERTIHRWLDEPDFSAAYRKARREVFAQAVALSGRYASLAVHTLAQVMADKAAPVSARVSAASSMLKFARESIEMDDLAVRLEALERASRAADESPSLAA